MLAYHRYVTSRALRKKSTAYDEINLDNTEPGVILAGYGRYGQIVGRLLRATGINVTVLEKTRTNRVIKKIWLSGLFWRRISPGYIKKCWNS
ncbi:hypothetical protein [Legionella tunisiensis]|uniref:hypothetical protein n=1 Tax=Legionella tunisiensis TaxID=1034944 RepID=UPI001E5289D9|nr:hypothetical protein [Legionella tunisiensis]